MTESLSAATSEQYHSCAHTAAPCTSNLSAPQKSMHGACLNLPVLPTRSNPPCTFLALALVLKAAISTTPCADLPRITPSAPADAGASPAGAGQGQQAGKERHAGCTPAHARCATGLCGVHMQNHNLLNGRPTWHITAAVPNTPPPPEAACSAHRQPVHMNSPSATKQRMCRMYCRWCSWSALTCQDSVCRPHRRMHHVRRTSVQQDDHHTSPALTLNQ
jgi:hypothetical protein